MLAAKIDRVRVLQKDKSFVTEVNATFGTTLAKFLVVHKATHLRLGHTFPLHNILNPNK